MRKKKTYVHTYIFFFFTLSPWRNLWNTSHSKAPRFPLRNFNKRRFIIAPLKGISTMLIEPFSTCSILEYTKKTSRNRVMSLLRKSEMSSVSSKAKEAISCRPLRVGGRGRGRDEEADNISDYGWACTTCSWDTVSNPAVPQSWPLVYQQMLPLVQKFKLRRLQRLVTVQAELPFLFLM